jgi:predicted metal-dependent hydrolase
VIKRNDTRDIDAYELKLIRVGHYLWALYKRSARKSEPLGERMALEQALEAVWNIKREYRQQLALKRAESNAVVRERFATLKRKAA